MQGPFLFKTRGANSGLENGWVPLIFHAVFIKAADKQSRREAAALSPVVLCNWFRKCGVIFFLET